MSDAWKSLPLAEVVERVRRRTGDGDHRVLTVSAEFGLVDQQSYFTKSVASKDISGYWLLEPGDFVYNKSTSANAPWGVIARHEGEFPGAVTPLYIPFRPKESVASSDFLVLALNSPQFFESLRGLLREGARSHGALNVRLSDFYEATVSIPPCPVQDRIVALVKSLDDQIDALVGELRSFELTAEALLGHTMGSFEELVPLSSVLAQAQSGGTPSRKNAGFYTGGIPWLKSGEVANSSITSTSETISEHALEKSSTWLVPAGAVVIAMYGATASQVGYLARPMATNQAVLALVVDAERADSRFLFHWMRYNSSRLKTLAVGAAQPNLSKAVILRECEFPTIAVSTQQEIAKMLDAVLDYGESLADEIESLRAARAATLSALLRRDLEIPESIDQILTEQATI